MDAQTLQVSILSKILTSLLNIDLSDIFTISPSSITSSITINIIPPPSTQGLYKITINNPTNPSNPTENQPQTQQKTTIEEKDKKDDEKKKNRRILNKKYSKVSTNYKSGMESEDEERRIKRKIELAITSNNMYSDYETYVRNHLSIDEMMQSRDERYKCIPMFGFSVYMQTLKSISNGVKTLQKNEFKEWEIRMLCKPESLKYTITSDDIDLITQGQSIYYSNMSSRSKISKDTFIQSIKTPLLQYISIEKILYDFFNYVSTFMGCLDRSTSKTSKYDILIYQLEETTKDVKKWGLVESWHDFIVELSSQLSSYLVSSFRDIYFLNYRDNSYRDTFNTVPELQIIFKNIQFIINYPLLDQTIRDILVSQRLIPETSNNRFDTYRKEKTIPIINNVQQDIKKMIESSMFDEIPDDITIL